jgi:hypothetical protein
MEIKPHNMQKHELELLVAERLEYMGEQVAYLYSQNLDEEAKLLSQEGLMLAEAYDNEETFLFIGGLTEV